MEEQAQPAGGAGHERRVDASGSGGGPAVRYPAIKKSTKKPRKKRPTTTKAA